eukprot:SAG31_NODE_3526_length_4156_cov_1.726645_4_plen_184_part_00
MPVGTCNSKLLRLECMHHLQLILRRQHPIGLDIDCQSAIASISSMLQSKSENGLRRTNAVSWLGAWAPVSASASAFKSSISDRRRATARSLQCQKRVSCHKHAQQWIRSQSWRSWGVETAPQLRVWNAGELFGLSGSFCLHEHSHSFLHAASAVVRMRCGRSKRYTKTRNVKQHRTDIVLRPL